MVRGTKNRQRGSAMVMTVLLIALISFAFVAAQEIAGANQQSFERLETEIRLQYAKESKEAWITTAHREGTLAIPAIASQTIGGVKVTSSISDNDSSVRDTYRADMTMQLDGRSHMTAVIGSKRSSASPWFYAVYTVDDLDIRNSLTVNGSVFAKEPIYDGVSSVTVSEDFETSSSSSLNYASVQGQKWTDAPFLRFEKPKKDDYNAARDNLLTIVSTLVGVVFDTADELIFLSGNLTLEGEVSGQGTLYVDGTATLQNNVMPADATSRLNIVAANDIVFKSGTYFGNFSALDGKIIVVGPGPVVVNGSLVADDIEVKAPTTVNMSSEIWNATSRAADYKLPGHWPFGTVSEEITP